MAERLVHRLILTENIFDPYSTHDDIVALMRNVVRDEGVYTEKNK